MPSCPGSESPRDLIIATHHNLPTPLVWCWDNLNVHLALSLLKRSMVNFAAADLEGLVRIVKRKLKKIQYRPHLLDGCLATTGLTIEPW